MQSIIYVNVEMFTVERLYDYYVRRYLSWWWWKSLHLFGLGERRMH